MKYYQGRLVWSIMWLVSGSLWLLQGISQFEMGNNGFWLDVLVALLSLFNAYYIRNRYIALGEGKLVVNSSCIIKTVIMLANITSSEQTGKKLRLTYNEGSRLMNQKVKLSILKDLDREEFLRDLHSELSK
ncbi:conserved hypothetical protein [Candidatus Desulfosporosinus infrequens]|uniref:DUF5673 domain-containing protein n=1 Tax=Candidatus Desulfosporosinus infrequens TaxID=2043169 RepID=A0A2U3JYN3_9FIRM|nr:conserved hypothetical protein [Candidatus Desulfosporosinus infrequens]